MTLFPYTTALPICQKALDEKTKKVNVKKEAANPADIKTGKIYCKYIFTYQTYFFSED